MSTPPTLPRPPLDHELIRRISLDLADGYDEEPEMEIELALLKQFHYQETPKAPIVLPQREHHEHYSRQAVPAEMLVPEVY
jgi:hypothetical protein